MSRANTGTSPVDFIQEKLPGLGFVGNTWADRLKLTVSAPVTSVKVTSQDGALDLRGIRVSRDKDDQSITYKVMSSGEAGGRKVDQDLFKLTAVHSRSKADHAWWKVEFDGPVQLSEVLIFGTVSRPNLGIRVEATTASGGRMMLFDRMSPRYIGSVLAALTKYVSVRTVYRQVHSVTEAYTWRSQVVAELNETFKAGAPAPDTEEWGLIASVLPVQEGSNGSYALDDQDFFLLAYRLMCQVARNSDSRSGWKSYAGVLPGRTQLRELESEFSQCARLLGIPQRSLTRHGLVASGALQEETPAIAKLVTKLRADLQALGLTPLLAYGSLLGHVREGHLLTHDDDFDSMVCLESGSREEFDAYRADVVTELRSMGWRVKTNGKFWNIHVEQDGAGTHVDVFFVHVQGQHAFTHMERMKVRPVPKAWLETGSVVNVDGVEIAVPKESERFLADRYGEDWTVSDPYADWPWPLAD